LRGGLVRRTSTTWSASSGSMVGMPSSPICLRRSRWTALRGARSVSMKGARRCSKGISALEHDARRAWNCPMRFWISGLSCRPDHSQLPTARPRGACSGHCGELQGCRLVTASLATPTTARSKMLDKNRRQFYRGQVVKQVFDDGGNHVARTACYSDHYRCARLR
jgi:hypothetical protein